MAVFPPCPMFERIGPSDLSSPLSGVPNVPVRCRARRAFRLLSPRRKTTYRFGVCARNWVIFAACGLRWRGSRGESTSKTAPSSAPFWSFTTNLPIATSMCWLLAEVCHGKPSPAFLPGGAQGFRALSCRPPCSLPQSHILLRLPPLSLWYNSVCLTCAVTRSCYGFFPPLHRCCHCWSLQSCGEKNDSL